MSRPSLHCTTHASFIFVCFFCSLLMARPCPADYAFNYGPLSEPITSATVHVDVAAMTAHRSAFKAEVNFLRLVDVNGSSGTLDLSSILFGSAEYPDPAAVNQGSTETGLLSASIDSSFFPALASGQLGLWALLTDTGDGLFAIDTIMLEIETSQGVIFSTYGSGNDGFGLGLADYASLPAPLPGPLPFGSTGTGFDETITSKSIYVVPGPGAAVVLLGGLLAPGRSRRRACASRTSHSFPATSRFMLMAIICGLTASASLAQEEKQPDPALQCATQDPAPDDGCLASKPRADDLHPRLEIELLPPQTVDLYDPATWQWLKYEVASGQITEFPVDPDYVPIDPNFVGQAEGSLGCAAEVCEGGIATVFAPDTRVRITKTTELPYCMVGQIAAHFPNNKIQYGTGALIGPHHVLTAGHIVCPNGAFPERLLFFPGQNGVSRGLNADESYPFGGANGTVFYTYKGFKEKQVKEADLAVVILDKSIGNRTSWFGRYSVIDANKTLHSAGYPHDKASGEQWYGNSAVDSQPDFFVRHTIDTFKGQSGAPVWQVYDEGRYVVGVHTGGPDNTINHAVRLAGGHYGSVDKWIKMHPDPYIPFAGPPKDPCEDCGDDCNHNDTGDNLDIASGFSLDENEDGIPDECQPDQLHLFGPSPNPVNAGEDATIQAVVERQFQPLTNRVVGFTVLAGDITFTDGGMPDPDGKTITAAADSDGEATITFKAGPDSGGTTALIQASCSDAPLTAYALVQIASPAKPPSLGDVNGDGNVDIDDLFAVIAAWGPCPNCDMIVCEADLDDDCNTDIDDLFIVIANWS